MRLANMLGVHYNVTIYGSDPHTRGQVQGLFVENVCEITPGLSSSQGYLPLQQAGETCLFQFISFRMCNSGILH